MLNILEIVHVDQCGGEQIYQAPPGASSAFPSLAEHTINSYSKGDNASKSTAKSAELECFGCGGPHPWSKLKVANGQSFALMPQSLASRNLPCCRSHSFKPARRSKLVSTGRRETPTLSTGKTCPPRVGRVSFSSNNHFQRWSLTRTRVFTPPSLEPPISKAWAPSTISPSIKTLSLSSFPILPSRPSLLQSTALWHMLHSIQACPTRNGTVWHSNVLTPEPHLALLTSTSRRWLSASFLTS